MASRWGSDPVSIGECGAARFDRFAYARNFVRRKVVDDDDIVALELGARPDEVFATHSRERRPHLLLSDRMARVICYMARVICYYAPGLTT